MGFAGHSLTSPYTPEQKKVVAQKERNPTIMNMARNMLDSHVLGSQDERREESLYF